MALSGLAALVPALRPVLWVLDAAFVLVALVDLGCTPDPRRARLERRLPGTVGLSTELVRTLDLRLEGAGGLPFEVRESFPQSFQVLQRTVLTPAGESAWEPAPPEDPSGGPDCGRFDAQGGAVVRRSFTAKRRGLHAFGNVRLRVQSPWGLFWKQAELGAEQGLSVEPALADLRHTLRLAASDRWWDLGVRLLRRRGGQTEFESLRDYVAGDDVRAVDWKAFARRGKPMVRQFQEERGQELILLFDCGRRMRATGDAAGERWRGWSKLDWALDAGLQLAAVALQKGDRVGCAAFVDGLSSFVQPARGGRQLTRLREAVAHLVPEPREADLGRALRELALQHRRRALVVVLSDVADPLSVPHERRALGSASRHHRLVFAALDDPGVRRAAEGVDAAPGAPGASGAPRAALRATALELVEERHRSLRALARPGVRVLSPLPAESAGPLLSAWLDERRSG